MIPSYIPYGHALYCDRCHRPRIVCDADVRGCAVKPSVAPRIIERYGVQFCAECGLVMEYCRHARG